MDSTARSDGVLAAWRQKGLDQRRFFPRPIRARCNTIYGFTDAQSLCRAMLHHMQVDLDKSALKKSQVMLCEGKQKFRVESEQRRRSQKG